ncbi:MAG: hypothetical protein ACLPSH_21785 [Vulcanimicrobiaceae bacterium]
MPQLSAIRPAVRLLAVAGVLAIVTPATLQGALASAAGTMFEATPFVLAAHLLRGTSLRWLVGMASCGCVRGVPGALSLPATALCWLSFGPWVALARLAAGVLLAMRSGPSRHDGEMGAGPLDELLVIGSGAALASLVVEALRLPGSSYIAPALAIVAGLVTGGFVGVLLPCTSAAIAIAAALRSAVPAASLAVLLTAGLTTPGLAATGLTASARSTRAPTSPRSSGRPQGKGHFALALLAAACGGLALHGGAGLVSPHFVPVVAAAVPLAVVCGRSARAATPSSWFVPAGLLAALALGSPPPSYVATETTLGDAFPGERITFTGVSYRSGSSTILQRFVITCCRADAVPVAVCTQQPLPVPDGTWLLANGKIVWSAAGPELAVLRWQRLSPPEDPFSYR